MGEHLAFDTVQFAVAYAIFIMSTFGAVSWYNVNNAEAEYWRNHNNENV